MPNLSYAFVCSGYMTSIGLIHYRIKEHVKVLNLFYDRDVDHSDYGLYVISTKWINNDDTVTLWPSCHNIKVDGDRMWIAFLVHDVAYLLNRNVYKDLCRAGQLEGTIRVSLSSMIKVSGREELTEMSERLQLKRKSSDEKGPILKKTRKMIK